MVSAAISKGNPSWSSKRIVSTLFPVAARRKIILGFTFIEAQSRASVRATTRLRKLGARFPLSFFQTFSLAAVTHSPKNYGNYDNPHRERCHRSIIVANLELGFVLKCTFPVRILEELNERYFVRTPPPPNAVRLWRSSGPGVARCLGGARGLHRTLPRKLKICKVPNNKP